MVDERGHLDLIVKKYPHGKSSMYLHNLQLGQYLFFIAPLQGYQWKANSYQHITLIAGGAGITPIYQLLQGILKNPDDKTAITLIFGVNTEKDLLLKKEFEECEKKYPERLNAVYMVSNPAEGSGSPYRKGRVTKKLLEEVAPSPKGRETMVFVCGPPAMEYALIGNSKEPGMLQDLGYRDNQIHKF